MRKDTLDEKEALAPYKEHPVTYEELKEHSTYSDAWISINGVIYDITHFIQNHPFGDTFRGHLGTECGGLFSSAHSTTNVEALIRNERFLTRNKIKVVGHLDVSGDHLSRNSDHPFLDRIVYKKTDSDDPFWLDLKTSVTSYLKDSGESTHYTFMEGVCYIAYYGSIYLLLSYLTWIQGALLGSILLGFHMVCAAANIAHMATHHGFTRSRLLDFVAIHLFDLGGMSGLEWQITHQTHHNQPHSSIDHQTNAYDVIGVRIHKYIRRREFQKLQFIYFWLVVSVYLSFKIFATTVWLLVNGEFVRHKREMAAHLVAKGMLLVLIIICAYIHGGWMAFSLFVLYSVSYSQSAFILLFNDHEETHEILGENEDVAEFHGKKSWAEVQVRSSGNWYPTNWFLAFVEFHYGYFNYHIEHHLFPTFKPRLLKTISPIVKSVCLRHNVPYLSTTFIEKQRSLQVHLSKLSLPTILDGSSL